MATRRRVRKKPLFKTSKTVAAKEDESGAADQADLGPNGSPRSKNYGQSIQRKRKRCSNSTSGPNSSRTPILPSQTQAEVSFQGDWNGVCLQNLLGSPQGSEYATELSMSAGKVVKVDESPCAVQCCENACSTVDGCNKLTSLMSTVSDSTEHCCSTKSMEEVAVNVPDCLLNTNHLVRSDSRPPSAEPNECIYTDNPQQCAGFTDASSAGTIGSLANSTTVHQQPCTAELGSMAIEDSFHMEKICGPKIASSAPIPDQEAGVESGQTLEDILCQCSTELKSHDHRDGDLYCSTFETQQDDLLDELFGIQQANPSTKNDIAEELLCGLCPEDLDSTLSTSLQLDAAKDEGCTSPWWHSAKSPKTQMTPSRFKVQEMTSSAMAPDSMMAGENVQVPKQQHCASDVHSLGALTEQTGGMCGEVANLGRAGSSCPAAIPGSELRSTKGATSALNVTGDEVQQVRGRGEGGGRGERGGGGGGGGGERGEGGGGERRRGGRGGGGGRWGTLHCYPTDTFYGLPLEVQACIKEHKGIMKLYDMRAQNNFLELVLPAADWQDTCLRLPNVASGCNLIYSLPTSGGKTLVAEILILQQLLLRRRDVLFVLPFVSIVQEKVRELLPFASVLGFAVEEYAASKGKIPPRKRRKKNVIYIATIEKANGLVNSLIELQRIGSIGLVVVDELHMVGDGGVRGATLETCLAKMLYCSAGTQIVGMSATLSNIQDLAQFLRAEIYSSDFRPVDLREYVKLERCVYSVTVERGNVNFHPERNIQDLNAQMDRDQLCPLVMEVIPQSSCLLFCPTKKSCQNVATLLATCLPRSLREVKHQARHNLLKLLSIEAAGVCPVLARTIPYGIAYHHSGLTADERRIIEEAYLEGTLCLLACTSTLAAGVNLPAKRVILRSPYIGCQFLTRSQYKQMIGRAGRAGLSEVGESILLLKHQEREKVADLLSGPYDRCSSSLLTGGVSAMLSLILTLIGLKLVRTSHDLNLFFQSTLLYVQHDSANLALQCQETVCRLVGMGCVSMENSTSSNDCFLMITPLGKATYKGCLPVKQAHVIYQDLVRAQQCLVLSTDLHLLHISTPPDLTSTITPNWMVYFETLTSLCPDDLKVAQLVGVSPGIVAKKATGTAGKMSDSSLSLYHRFYITLMLHSLLRAGSAHAVWVVAESFQCSRGFLQNIINSTAAFASCLVHFTEELPELWSLHLLFPVIGKRLAFSASIELVPLMEISGVKQGRAMQLLAAGYHTPQDIAAADPSTLSEQIEHLFPKNAKRLIHAAKVLLADQAEALYEEAEELMSLVPPQ